MGGKKKGVCLSGLYGYFKREVIPTPENQSRRQVSRRQVRWALKKPMRAKTPSRYGRRGGFCRQRLAT